MSQPWVQKPLTEEQAKAFKSLIERGYTVIRQDQGANSRLVVEKPQSRRKSRPTA